MPNRPILSIIVLCAGLALTLAPALADPVFPLGLRIGLEPPGDMVASKRFAGFEDAERKAAITILDLPVRAYLDLERSAFAAQQKGLSDVKRESFPFANGIGILLTGHGRENDTPVHKWFLMANAAGGPVPDLATLIGVQVPDSAASVYSDTVIRKALASVTFRPPPIAERLSLMPFHLTEMAGFHVVHVIPTGGVILTQGPSDDITIQPYMVVSAEPGSPANPDDRGRYARSLLANAPLSDLRIQSAEAMRVTGAPGFEIRAQGRGARGNEVAVVQWLRFTGSGHLRVVGVAAKDDWDRMFNLFRAVRDGVAFR